MLKIDTDCEKCGEGYTNVEERWCELCQIDNLKKSFVNWTSGSEILDDFIQEKQQEIHEIWNANGFDLAEQFSLNTHRRLSYDKSA